MRTFDAFISYNRSDSGFAKKLCSKLEKYKPPKSIEYKHSNHLNIFLDQEDMTGLEYEKAIKDHLKNSYKLIIICSPKSKLSNYVNQEIEFFSKENGPKNIIPVIIDGIPNTEATHLDDDRQAFPDELVKVIEKPVGKDFRKFDLKKDKLSRGQFKDEWFKLLAEILECSVTEVTEIERKRKKRSVRNRSIIALIIVFSMVIAGWQAFKLKNNQIANQLTALSEQVEPNNPTHALQLVLNSLKKDPKNEKARQQYHNLVSNSHQRPFYNFQLKEPSGGIPWGSFSPWSHVVTTSYDGMVRFWDSSGKLLNSLQMFKSAALRVIYSPSGQSILTSGVEGKAHLVSQDGKIETTFECHQYPIEIASFISEDTILLGSYLDGSIQIWTSNGIKVKEFKIPVPVNDDITIETLSAVIDGRKYSLSKQTEMILAASPNGQYILTDLLGEIHLWKWGKTIEKIELDFPGIPTRKNTKFSNDSRFFLIDCDLYTINGIKIRTLDCPKNKSVVAHGISPDNKLIAVAFEESNTISIFNPLGDVLAILDGHGNIINSLEISWDNEQLLSSSEDGSSNIWDIVNSNTILKRHIEFADLAYNGQFIVFTEQDMNTSLSDLMGKINTVWGSIQAVGSCVRIAPNDSLIAIGNWDGSINIVEISRGSNIYIEAHEETIFDLKISPDASKMISLGADQTARIWSLPLGNSLTVIPIHGITSIAFSSQKNIIAGTVNGRIYELDIENKISKQIAQLEDSGYISQIVVSPNKRDFLTGGLDSKVKSWSMNGKRRIIFGEFPSPVSSIAYSQDGRYIAAGDRTGIIKVWTKDGFLLQTTNLQQGWIKNLKFTPDNRKIMSIGNEGRGVKLISVLDYTSASSYLNKIF